jgi:uncharacterized protein (DUF1015 family)
MARIRPFRAILYDRRAVGDLSKVVAPPYDVISEDMQEEYYRLHGKNVIRLILGKTRAEDTDSDNRYTRAKEFFEEWMAEGVLKQDEEPSIYIYEQKYSFRGKLKTQLGFIALMKIEDPHESRVLPHEYTLARPKRDRMELLKATRTNMSPIFSLFEDRDSAVMSVVAEHTKGEPIVDIEHEGVTHRMWRLSDRAAINRISAILEEKPVFIADGHHRYEVALNYRDRARRKTKPGTPEGPDDYLPVYFSNLDAGALTVLSTHRAIRSVKRLDPDRILSSLERYFSIEKHHGREGMLGCMEKAPAGEYVFGMYHKSRGFFTLTLKDKDILDGDMAGGRCYPWKCLDVTVLHKLIFDRLLKIKERVEKRDNIVYTREVDYALYLVDKEGYDVAFFLNPPKVEQIRDVASSRDRMPKKTTYFYPKPLSGLVFYKHGD